MGIRVPRTRNGGKWTQSMLMGRIRSALRRIWMYYEPRKIAKNNARRTVKGKRHKYEYQCSVCTKWFVSKMVEVNHKIPAGSLKTFEDLAGFCERLFCEDPNGYECTCKKCHQKITNEQRKKK
jgi:hypothetical protein